MNRRKEPELNIRSRSRPLPDNYICIAPEESLMVFDYLRGREDVDKTLVALHVHLCLHCHETIMSLKDIDKARKDQLMMADAL
jgi:hypothetical protein